MPAILPYATESSPRKTILPTFTMLFGLLSGPLAITICIVLNKLSVENDTAFMISLIAPQLIALSFAIIVRFAWQLVPRDRVFASIGIFASIGWIIVIWTYIYWLLGTVE